MKKNLLFAFIACLVFTATNNLKAQALYSNFAPSSFDGYLPGTAFGTNQSLFDDIEIPDQTGDSINITLVKVAIYRPSSAPAATFTLLYTTLDPNGTGAPIDSSYVTVPPTEITPGITLPKSGLGVTTDILSFGDSVHTLFKIPTPTTEIVPGYKTVYIGLLYSAAKTNGWWICTPGTEDTNTNINVAAAPANGGGGLWVYAAPSMYAVSVYQVEGTDTVWTPSTMSIQAFGTFTATLPVTFLSFNGVLDNNIGVLNWSTSRELNNKGFEVEKSADGQTFSDIGFVAGTGTTSNISNYTFSDPKMISGDNYYRLKQVDLDGNYNYSSIINLEFSKLDWSIIGNPSNNSSVQLQLDKQHTVALQVVSFSGEVIQTINKGTIGQGTYSIPLDLSHAASGMYIVRMIIDGQSSSKNIMK